MNETIKNKIPPSLGGEADKDSYFMIDGNNNKVSGNEIVFPILKEIRKAEWELIGTGFFITTNGIFVSAKHVFEDVMDENKQQKYPIFILQKLPNNKIIQRNVRQCSTHQYADVGIGVLDQMKDDKTGRLLENKIAVLTTITPNIGERIVTYAFPRHKKITGNDGFEFIFMPDFYDGKLEEYYINGRDSSSLPAPCYRTSINIHGAASGGPVFGPKGQVFGVNSKSYNPYSDVSFISRINEILSLKINNIVLPNKSKPEATTIFELSKIGQVIFKPKSHLLQIRDKNRIILYSY